MKQPKGPAAGELERFARRGNAAQRAVDEAIARNTVTVPVQPERVAELIAGAAKHEAAYCLGLLVSASFVACETYERDAESFDAGDHAKAMRRLRATAQLIFDRLQSEANLLERDR